MANEVRDILNDEIFWLVAMKDVDDVVDQIAPLRAFQSALIAGLRERLAGESGAEHIVLRNIFELYSPDIAKWL
jgi:hypothetical protein